MSNVYYEESSGRQCVTCWKRWNGFGLECNDCRRDKQLKASADQLQAQADKVFEENKWRAFDAREDARWDSFIGKRNSEAAAKAGAEATQATEALTAAQNQANYLEEEREERELERGETTKAEQEENIRVKLNFSKMMLVIQANDVKSIYTPFRDLCIQLNVAKENNPSRTLWESKTYKDTVDFKSNIENEFTPERAAMYRECFANYTMANTDKIAVTLAALEVFEEYAEFAQDERERDRVKDAKDTFEHEERERTLRAGRW